ncbi:MAG: TetR/AcrR family transcriptional regulator [Prevotella sp.]|nr:TetR/AcrR family transcriptional regulator [Prevotella sp.]
MGRKSSSIEYRKDLRVKILDVSVEMFREKGFRAVKMDDVARHLCISKRTLYEIYPNKEDLVFEAIRKGVVRMHEQLKQRIFDGGDTMDVLIEYFKMRIEEAERINPAIIDDVRAYPKIKEFFEQYKQENSNISVEFLRRGQMEGYFRNDVNINIVSYIYRAISDSMSISQFHKQFPLTELLRVLVVIFARGLCTPAGMARIDEMLDSWELKTNEITGLKD